MKYSLRSLMIAVTLVCVSLAWASHLAYCFKQASEHERNVREVAGFEVLDGTEASEKALMKRVWKREQEHHSRLAVAYRHAAWFPWERLWIDEKRELIPVTNLEP